MRCSSSRTGTTTHQKLLTSCLAAALACASGANASTNLQAPPAPSAAPAATTAAHVLPLLDVQWLEPQLLRAHRQPPAVPAASIPVTNCNDAGTGSLRDAISGAASGDTIDLTGLSCSTITLTTGMISIGQDDLTLQGPGMLALEVSGNDASRVFWHVGDGTLRINDMTVSHGHKYLAEGDTGNPAGGCVFSLGHVTMDHAWAKYCKAESSDVDTPVRGGAIYAKLGLGLFNSFITSSEAKSTAFETRGGGAYTQGAAMIIESIIENNAATGPVANTGGGIQTGSLRAGGVAGDDVLSKYSTFNNNHAMLGGGIYTNADLSVLNSTVSGNSACGGGGIYVVHGANGSGPVVLDNSTVSGNEAWCAKRPAGITLWNRDGDFRDSTIAFNVTEGSGTKYGAGVRVPNSANTVTLNNTIISNNTLFDGSIHRVDDIGGAGTTSGANNLVFYPSSMTMPAGTILLTDPMLRPLANNGGLTRTHMPNFGSPVIDVGNNVSGATVDQRGSGFPRIRGSQADIGAIEFNLADSIFDDGFDS
ncbi:MAG: right-handed parallel beta-helix repeat-containing protein [Dokdonella sp.]|nr:MAG: right-handed parallel beta-helix repeat-containing protein [Dokdonella sp.]